MLWIRFMQNLTLHKRAKGKRETPSFEIFRLDMYLDSILFWYMCTLICKMNLFRFKTAVNVICIPSRQVTTDSGIGDSQSIFNLVNVVRLKGMLSIFSYVKKISMTNFCVEKCHGKLNVLLDVCMNKTYGKSIYGTCIGCFFMALPLISLCLYYLNSGYKLWCGREWMRHICWYGYGMSEWGHVCQHYRKLHVRMTMLWWR